jgi:hypothetical protein
LLVAERKKDRCLPACTFNASAAKLHMDKKIIPAKKSKGEGKTMCNQRIEKGKETANILGDPPREIPSTGPI